MNILYDDEKLKELLLDFYNATGVSISLIKDDFSYVDGITSVVSVSRNTSTKYCDVFKTMKKARQCCIKCDCDILERCRISRNIEVHTCHAGLVDIGIPIMHGTKVLCYIIMGQMKKDADFEVVRKHLNDLGCDLDEMRKYYEELPLYDEEKIKSVANLAVMLTKHIMFEKMLKLEYNANIEKAVTYIDENLNSDISVEKLSKEISVSKTVLYENFRKIFDCTINEYVVNKRIEKSIEYLLNTEMSMDEIAQAVGFKSAAYYSLVFKKKKGTSPLKFKNNYKKREGR